MNTQMVDALASKIGNYMASALIHGSDMLSVYRSRVATLETAFAKTTDFVLASRSYNWEHPWTHLDPLQESLGKIRNPALPFAGAISAIVKMSAEWVTLASRPRAERRREPLWDYSNKLCSTVYGAMFHIGAAVIARTLLIAMTHAWRRPGARAAVVLDFNRPILPERAVDTFKATTLEDASRERCQLLADSICRHAKLVVFNQFVVRNNDAYDGVTGDVDLSSTFDEGMLIVRTGQRHVVIGSDTIIELKPADRLIVDGHDVTFASLVSRVENEATGGAWDTKPASQNENTAPRTGGGSRFRFVFSVEEGPWFRPQKKYRRRFSVQEVRHIRQLYAEGMSVKDITFRLQAEWNVKLFLSSISKICANESYKYDTNLSAGSHHVSC